MPNYYDSDTVYLICALSTRLAAVLPLFLLFNAIDAHLARLLGDDPLERAASFGLFGERGWVKVLRCVFEQPFWADLCDGTDELRLVKPSLNRLAVEK